MSLRKCIVDGTEYEYCSSCGSSKKQGYSVLFCCENCKNVFVICQDYNVGKINIAKAKEELKKCDLSKIDTFEKSTKAIIEKILGNVKVADKTEIKEEVKEVTKIEKTIEKKVEEKADEVTSEKDSKEKKFFKVDKKKK